MLRTAGGVLWTAINRMFEDDALPLAAALAYYSLLSMAPLLLVVVSVAGTFFADGQVHMQLIEQMRRLVGEEGASLTQTVIEHTGSEERSQWSLAIGALLTLLGASTVFGQLQYALNRVWRVKATPHVALIVSFIKQRILSFALVLSVGFLVDGVVGDQRRARHAAHLSRHAARRRRVVLEWVGSGGLVHAGHGADRDDVQISARRRDRVARHVAAAR